MPPARQNSIRLKSLTVLACALALTLAVTQSWAKSQGGSQSSQGGGDGSSSGSPPSSSGASPEQQEAAQQLMNSVPGQLMQYGLRPIRYLAPQAYQGLQSDLTNSYYMMTNGANKGYSNLASQFSSIGDTFMDRYQSVQSRLVGNLRAQIASQEQLINQLYEMVSNPEQMCRDMAKQAQVMAQEAGQQVGQMGQQANQMTSQANQMVSQMARPVQQQAQQAQQQTSSLLNRWIGK